VRPNGAFEEWCSTLGLSNRYARRLWWALSKSPCPETKAFLFEVHAFDTVRTESQLHQRAKQFLTGVGNPQAIVRMAETAVADHALTWSQANVLIGAVLARLTCAGRWK
jgi:hypothetical protein